MKFLTKQPKEPVMKYGAKGIRDTLTQVTKEIKNVQQAHRKSK